MSKYEKIENAKAKLTVEIDKEAWKDAQKAAFKKLARNVQIKGFRKGQAPENMVRKVVSSSQIMYEAVDNIAQSELLKALDEQKVELIDRPSLEIEKISDTECVLNFICPVKPDVTIKQYKGLGYAPKKVTVKAAEVEEEIKRIQESKAELELKEDGKVEKGDTAVIDYEGFKDGVPFEGGKGENYSLEIGSGSFIPGFEDQLIGMKAEETRDIEVTFPENYHEESLKGADAKFTVTVHEIKAKVLPEMTEELIAELKLDGVKTLEDLKKYEKEKLKKNKENDAVNAATEELMTKLADQAEVDIPEVMIDNEVENMYNDYAQRMQYQGIDMATYFKITGSSKEDFCKMMKPDAEKKVKMSLVLEEIAKLENITVSDEDLDKEYADMAEYYSMSTDEIKKHVSKDSLEGDLKLRKALEFVKNN